VAVVDDDGKDNDDGGGDEDDDELGVGCSNVSVRQAFSHQTDSRASLSPDPAF
jgi:hypothetical protein